MAIDGQPDERRRRRYGLALDIIRRAMHLQRVGQAGGEIIHVVLLCWPVGLTSYRMLAMLMTIMILINWKLLHGSKQTKMCGVVNMKSA